MRIKSVKRAFTLVEMLVVVLVVGVVAAVGITSYIKSVETQRQGEAQTLVGSIAAAQRLYNLQNGSYVTGSIDASNNPLIAAHLLSDADWADECYSYTGADQATSPHYVVNATRNASGNCSTTLSAYTGYGVCADANGKVLSYTNGSCSLIPTTTTTTTSVTTTSSTTSTVCLASGASCGTISEVYSGGMCVVHAGSNDCGSCCSGGDTVSCTGTCPPSTETCTLKCN